MRRYDVKAIAREIELHQVDESTESELTYSTNTTTREVEALKIEEAGGSKGVVAYCGQAVLGEVKQLGGGVEAWGDGGEAGASAQGRLLAAAPLALAVARTVGGGGRRQCEHQQHPHTPRPITPCRAVRLHPRASFPGLRLSCVEKNLR